MFNSRNNKLVPAINLVICTLLQRDTGSLDLSPELNFETNPGPNLHRISLFGFEFECISEFYCSVPQISRSFSPFLSTSHLDAFLPSSFQSVRSDRGAFMS